MIWESRREFQVSGSVIARQAANFEGESEAGGEEKRTNAEEFVIRSVLPS